MSEENKKNSSDTKKTIIISIVIVLLFIISIFTLSYAFFTAKTNTTVDENMGIDATTKNFDTSLEEEGNLELTIIPGEVFTKTFTVTNKANTFKFKIVALNITNGFENPEDITYEITKKDGTSVKTNTQFPSTAEKTDLSDEITLREGETETYTLKITYKNTDIDQSSDMGKTITGQLQVEVVGFEG